MADKLASNSLSYAEVQTLVKEHRAYTQQHPKFTKNTSARCVWFDIDRLKAMVTRMEASGADGLRVYFGRYPAEGFTGKFTPNINTVVFVPTKEINGVAKSDYFKDDEGDTAENRGELCEPNCGGSDDGLG